MSDEDGNSGIELVDQHAEIRSEIRADDDYFIYRGQQSVRDQHDYRGTIPGLKEALGRFFHRHTFSFGLAASITVGMVYLTATVFTGGAIMAGALIAGAAGLSTVLLAKDMYEDNSARRQAKHEKKEQDRLEYLQKKGLIKETPEPTSLDSKQNQQSDTTKGSYSASKNQQLLGNQR